MRQRLFNIATAVSLLLFLAVGTLWVRSLRHFEIVDVRYLGTLENIFEYLGRPGHELVRVFEAHFADASLYEQDSFECVEANQTRFTCIWKPLADFAHAPLYPNGLLELLS